VLVAGGPSQALSRAAHRLRSGVRGRIVVSGPAAAHGTITLRGGAVTGTLGGVRAHS